MNMKFVFTIALLLITGSLLAQHATSFVEVDGGASIPLGNWGKTPTASSLVSLTGTINDKNGYARTSGFFSADGAWFFSKYFGVGLMFKYGTYGLKGVDSLSQGYEESFDVDTTKTYVTHYKMWSVLPGLYFNYPLAHRLALTARALVGVADASTPRITVDIIDGGVPDPAVVQESATKAALAFGLGAGIRYQFFHGLALQARADYFYTKPDFTIDNSGRNNSSGREVTEYNQPLSSVNVSLGVAYLFRH
jgi:hypothetical protein